jgi:hypothetical protein
MDRAGELGVRLELELLFAKVMIRYRRLRLARTPLASPATSGTLRWNIRQQRAEAILRMLGVPDPEASRIAALGLRDIEA